MKKEKLSCQERFSSFTNLSGVIRIFSHIVQNKILSIISLLHYLRKYPSSIFSQNTTQWKTEQREYNFPLSTYPHPQQILSIWDISISSALHVLMRLWDKCGSHVRSGYEFGYPSTMEKDHPPMESHNGSTNFVPGLYYHIVQLQYIRIYNLPHSVWHCNEWHFSAAISYIFQNK